jgi:hypothetical protein
MKHQFKYKPPGKKLLTGNDGHITLDFNIPEHAEFFLERFGGEEHIKTEYPLVYKAYQRSKQKSLEEKSHIKQDGDVGEDLLPEYANLTPVGYTSAPVQDQSQSRTSEAELMLSSTGLLHTKVNPAYVMMTGVMYSEAENKSTDPEILDSFGYYDDEPATNDATGELAYAMQNMVQWDDQELSSEMEVYYVTDDGIIKTDHLTTDSVFCMGKQAIVKSIELSDPVNKNTSGKKNDPLIVLYGRDAVNGECEDYNYPGLQPDGNKLIDFHFPLAGTITFGDKCFPQGLSTGSQSTGVYCALSDNGTIKMNYSVNEMKTFFTLDADNPHVLHFQFPDNWKSRLATANFGSSTILYLSASFFVNFKLDPKSDASTNIGLTCRYANETSYDNYFISQGPAVHVPGVSVRWGCFAKDTMIRMQDGTEKPICDIQPGEFVCTDSGEAIQVTDVVNGTEDKLITIVTEEGKEIRVSAAHPMVTAEKVVKQAADIRTSDQILNAEGKLEQVKFVYDCEYGDKVYNLETGGKAVVLIGNGLQTGGFELQNQTEPMSRKKEQKPLDQEVKALVEEMNRMMKETFG